MASVYLILPFDLCGGRRWQPFPEKFGLWILIARNDKVRREKRRSILLTWNLKKQNPASILLQASQLHKCLKLCGSPKEEPTSLISAQSLKAPRELRITGVLKSHDMTGQEGWAFPNKYWYWPSDFHDDGFQRECLLSEGSDWQVMF